MTGDRYNRPRRGERNWGAQLNENFERLDRDVEVRDVVDNIDDYDPVGGAKFLAVDTGTEYFGDGSEWQKVPGSGLNQELESVSATNVAGTRVVGPDGFESIQAAHDDLPSEGGRIKLLADHYENNITFTKQVVLTGVGAAWGTDGPGTLFVSGGDGIEIRTPGCIVEDLEIRGDADSAYGIRVYNPDGQGGRQVLRNVAIRDIGGDGLLLNGRNSASKFDVSTANCGRHGIHIDCGSEYFNANTFSRTISQYNDGSGIHVAGRAVTGNTFENLIVENNQRGLYVEDDVGRFQGNSLAGYGFEANDVHVHVRCADASNNVCTVNNIYPFDGLDVDGGTFAFVTSTQTGPRFPATMSAYLTEDWGDGKLENRDRQITGLYAGTLDTPGAMESRQGTFRPDWNVSGGVLAESGHVVLQPDGDTSVVSTRNRLLSGSYRYQFRFDGPLTKGAVQFHTLYENFSNRYTILLDEQRVELRVRSNGGDVETLVAGSWSADTDHHTVGWDRSADGDAELFFDGESLGTARCTFEPVEPRTLLALTSAADAPLWLTGVEYR